MLLLKKSELSLLWDWFLASVPHRDQGLRTVGRTQWPDKMTKNESCGPVACCPTLGTGAVFLSSCWEVSTAVSGLLSSRTGKSGRSIRLLKQRTLKNGNLPQESCSRRKGTNKKRNLSPGKIFHTVPTMYQRPPHRKRPMPRQWLVNSRWDHTLIGTA